MHPEVDLEDCIQIFDKQGPLSAHINGYWPRDGQQKMSSLVYDAILQDDHLVIEAASGAGKTLAYLIPALMLGKKTIISTATHYLQNQLYHNDIPLAQKALSSSRSVAILKGRSNYVCPYYLEKALNGSMAIAKHIRLQLTILWQRFKESSSGYWSELLPELDSAALSYATCSAEQCLNQHCPQLLRCPLIQARERARWADIVIINHSLLFVDQVMQREQYRDLLPIFDVVIVDEAHRLTEFAQTLVGHYLSSRQLKDYCRDAISAVTLFAPDQKPVSGFLKQLEQAISWLGKTLQRGQRYNRHQHEGIVEQLIQVFEQLLVCTTHIAERSQALFEIKIRTQLLKSKLELIRCRSGLCWVEPVTHGFVLRNIPVNLSPLIQALFNTTSASWIFTSATLSVSNNADRFLQCFGLPRSHFHQVSSAIDYVNNAVLYTPLLPVTPDHCDYPQHVLEQTLKLLELIRGRTLFLFSSHDMLKALAKILVKRCARPLFVHGTLSHIQLIEKFKHSEEGVLLGTGSFWEGLDLSGVPLACVIIDKLPFASPGDPLVKLRSDDLSAHGIDSFQEYLLPDAVVRLRQGCGRLLRRLSDRGVIMLADPRLHSKDYAGVFINSLPTMNRTYHLAPLRDFLHRHSILRSSD